MKRLSTHPTAARIRIGWFSLLALTALSVPAQAVTPATLIGPDLEPRPVQLVSVSQGQVTYFDGSRQMRRLAWHELVQLRDLPRPEDPSPPAPDAPAADAAGMIELTDGTRLAGQLTGVTDDGQALQWTHPGLGQITVTLEDLVAWSPRGPLGPSHAPGRDRASMVNGDTIEGFVERLLTIKPQGADQAVTLPLDQLARLELANPPAASSLDQVHLRDGSRVRVRDLTLTGETVTASLVLGGTTRPVAWPVTAVAQVDVRQRGRTLTRLVELPWRVTAGGEVFGVHWPPRVKDDTLLAHAPLTLVVDLPEGARRVAATVELDLEEVPVHQRTLADCRVIFEVAGAEQAVVHLNARQSRSRVNLPVGSGTLIVRLDPAAGGPVLDRVRLAEARVLVETAP